LDKDVQRAAKKLETRCDWAKGELYAQYHDLEWGVPVHDDGKLFEYLILEGAQAGLSWITVLKKRENYRQAFDEFDPVLVAEYTPEKHAELLLNPGIVRNRLKIASATRNAQRFLEVQAEFGSFDNYVWRFVDGTPIQNNFRERSEVPVRTEVSDALSRDLKKRGFNFIGTSICYAFMQAVGMVNDHFVTCFRHKELSS
jgi:DNA-3-methyladenine glycosylase I